MEKIKQRAGGALPKTPLPDLGEWVKFKSFSDLVEDDSWVNAPMVDYPCPECGEPEEQNAAFLAAFPNTPCEVCCDKKLVALDVSQQPTLPRLALPPQFLSTYIEHPNFPIAVWHKVEKFDPRNSQGLAFVGDTGGGKTRLLCKIAQRVVLVFQLDVQIFWSGEFQVEAAERLRSDRSFAAWRRRLRNVGLLCFDDLFCGKMSERAESALFDVIDERLRWEKPIVFTTQKTGKDIRAGSHDPKRAEALCRRLDEFCQRFVVPKNNKLTFKA